MNRYGDNSSCFLMKNKAQIIVQPVGDQMFIWYISGTTALKFERIAHGVYIAYDKDNTFEPCNDPEFEDAYSKHVADVFIKDIQVSK